MEEPCEEVEGQSRRNAADAAGASLQPEPASGSADATRASPQHEPLSASDDDFLSWALCPLPSLKRVRALPSFRALKDYLADRDLELHAESWCESVRADICKIAVKDQSKRMLLQRARQLVRRKDSECLPLLMALATACENLRSSSSKGKQNTPSHG